MLAYSIEQAQRSRYIHRVVVSTDDSEIAEVARQYGADVPFLRPAEYAADLSPDVDVFYHALSYLREQEGYQCDYVVHLRPPTILRCVADIDEAIELMLADQQADTLRSVAPATQSPYKMWVADGEYLQPILQHEGTVESQSMPRQLLPQVYWQNGYVDIIRSDVIFRRRMSGEKVIPFVVNKEVPELDHPEDLEKLHSWIRRHGLMVEPRSHSSPTRHAA